MFDKYTVGSRLGRAMVLPRDSGVFQRERRAVGVSHAPRDGASPLVLVSAARRGLA